MKDEQSVARHCSVEHFSDLATCIESNVWVVCSCDVCKGIITSKRKGKIGAKRLVQGALEAHLMGRGGVAHHILEEISGVSEPVFLE
jgi:hypothetical protein